MTIIDVNNSHSDTNLVDKLESCLFTNTSTWTLRAIRGISHRAVFVS